MLFITLHLLTSLNNIHVLFPFVFYLIVRLEYYLANPHGSFHFYSSFLLFSGQSISYFPPVLLISQPSLTRIFSFVSQLLLLPRNCVNFIQSNNSICLSSNYHYPCPKIRPLTLPFAPLLCSPPSGQDHRGNFILIGFDYYISFIA